VSPLHKEQIDWRSLTSEELDELFVDYYKDKPHGNHKDMSPETRRELDKLNENTKNLVNKELFQLQMTQVTDSIQGLKEQMKDMWKKIDKKIDKMDESSQKRHEGFEKRLDNLEAYKEMLNQIKTERADNKKRMWDTIWKYGIIGIMALLTISQFREALFKF
jgi:hypothetical protein